MVPKHWSEQTEEKHEREKSTLGQRILEVLGWLLLGVWMFVLGVTVVGETAIGGLLFIGSGIGAVVTGIVAAFRRSTPVNPVEPPP